MKEGFSSTSAETPLEQSCQQDAGLTRLHTRGIHGRPPQLNYGCNLSHADPPGSSRTKRWWLKTHHDGLVGEVQIDALCRQQRLLLRNHVILRLCDARNSQFLEIMFKQTHKVGKTNAMVATLGVRKRGQGAAIVPCSTNESTSQLSETSS